MVETFHDFVNFLKIWYDIFGGDSSEIVHLVEEVPYKGDEASISKIVRIWYWRPVELEETAVFSLMDVPLIHSFDSLKLES